MTNLLQPADVFWFSSIKKSYKAKWMDWYIYDPKTFTKNDNARSPGYIKFMLWLNEIWRNFDTQLVKKSFELCSIKKHIIYEENNLSIETDLLHSVLKHLLESKDVLKHLHLSSSILIKSWNSLKIMPMKMMKFFFWDE